VCDKQFYILLWFYVRCEENVENDKMGRPFHDTTHKCHRRLDKVHIDDKRQDTRILLTTTHLPRLWWKERCELETQTIFYEAKGPRRDTIQRRWWKGRSIL